MPSIGNKVEQTYTSERGPGEAFCKLERLLFSCPTIHPSAENASSSVRKERSLRYNMNKEQTCLKFGSLTFSLEFYLFYSNMSAKANTAITQSVG